MAITGLVSMVHDVLLIFKSATCLPIMMMVLDEVIEGNFILKNDNGQVASNIYWATVPLQCSPI